MNKWLVLRDKMLYFQFVPHMCMLLTHLFWHVNVRPFRDDPDPMYGKANTFLMVVLFLCVSYFLMIEILQMRTDCEGYVIGIV